MTKFTINEIDITNDVLLNTFNYMKRIDDVFGTGAFTFENQTIDYNIAPNSILKIDDSYFLCSSEATYHFGKKSWFHNVKIIEATSVLSRLLVGTKAFSITGSNTYDYEKINILLQLTSEKYGLNILFESANETNFNKKIEYVFTEGTTLFDALNDIAKNYNYRIYVSKIEDNKIYIDYIDLSNMNDLVISENKILSITKIQNAETYCKYLETEANNVIDTTNVSVIDNIYPTSNDVKLNEDSYILKLPTSIYKIKSFWVNIFSHLQTALKLPEDIGEVTQSYYQWSEQFPALKTIYDQYYSEYYPDWHIFSEQLWQSSGSFLSPVNNAGDLEHLEIIPKWKYYLTNKLLSKEQYDMVEEQYKPDYVYYNLGGNTIEGFNVYYKNDFWGTVIGVSNEPFIFNLATEIGTQQNHIGTIVEDVEILEFKLIPFNKIFNNTFGVEYYPLANPILVSTKKDTPENEVSYKPYALSYGRSDNYIDFDKLNNSLEIENQTTGKVELIIEYDITGMNFMQEFQKVIYDGKIWYVSNAEHKITATQKIVTLNLVSNYNKVADVISLNSQYNSVKNPLQDIVQRPIFVETNEEFTFTKGVTYIAVHFRFSNNEYKELFFSPTIFTNNNETYFYFEMVDQYNAGDRKIKMNSNNYKIAAVPYVDLNNELFKVAIRVFDIKSMEYERAKDLPYIDLKWYESGSAKLLKSLFSVYKDAREKLTFTIKANNCIIK